MNNIIETTDTVSLRSSAQAETEAQKIFIITKLKCFCDCLNTDVSYFLIKSTFLLLHVPFVSPSVFTEPLYLSVIKGLKKRTDCSHSGLLSMS